MELSSSNVKKNIRFSYISRNRALYFSAQAQKTKISTPKQNSLNFEEMELFSSNI